MKQKRQFHIAAVVAGLALAGSGSLCLAASVITETFDTDIAGWVVNYGTAGETSVSWNPTAGMGGGGCLQLTITNGGAQIGPLGTMPSSYPTAQYWKYEFDIMVDPSSGFDTNGPANSYGNFQSVMRDASWSWDSQWFGTLDSTYNTWQHKTVIIPSTLVRTETMLGFEVSASAGQFNGDVIVYIDNITITPVENPWVMHAFTNASEIATGFSSWSGGAALGATASLDTALDAGGGFTPLGSLELSVTYDPTNGNWQEGDVQFDWPSDPSRYSSFDFDLYLDTTNAGGIVNIFIRGGDYSWNNAGTIGINSSYVGKWTHCSVPLGALTLNSSVGYIFQCGGGNMSSTVYHFDNIKFVKVNTPPTITKLANGGPRGVDIVMDNNGDQWQRNGISTPTDTMPNLMWPSDFDSGATSVTYSFTLVDFPEATTHGGFEAHLFFVNSFTDPSGTSDPGNGATDWNAADLLVLNVTAVAAGGYDFSLHYKTNLPNANTPYTVATVHSPTAIGTWGITFTSKYDATMTGPGGISTNVTLDTSAVDYGFVTPTSFLQFGMFKNDGANDGHNNGDIGTFSRVQKVGGQSTFDDNFPGPSLTNNYDWRATSATAVQYIPDGVAKLLTWTLPADRFVPQVAGLITGPWTTITSTPVWISTATRRTAAIPTALLPAGNSAYFRLVQTNAP